MNIQQYIDENLPHCIRYNPKSLNTLIGLPYSYIVPCVSGLFQEMYYWDTYFTNKGLIIRGDLRLVRNNIDNMRYLIQKYGFVLNGNHTGYLYNSQPPFLSMMIKDYYEETNDNKWLNEAYIDLKREYEFWMTKRKSSIDLNYYDCMSLPKELISETARYFRERTGLCENDDDVLVARSMLSSGESGWDMNPRMTEKTYQFTPTDLNSLMYAMEDNLCYFARKLNRIEEAKIWHDLSIKRAELCRKYLKNSQELFMDYNYWERQLTDMFSVACFYPLYCGMANEKEAIAVKDNLYRIEKNYGVVTCEETDIEGNYQWGYPNGWAPMHMIVVGGLLRYGFKEDAYRIATKFIKMVENCYETTGHLWEKYNVLDGSVNVQNEYDMPAMLGWTFGTYTWMKDIIEKREVIV